MSIENSDYIKAETPKSNTKLQVIQFFQFCKFVIVIGWMLFIEFWRGFGRFFYSKKAEDITGQVCLVTGGANGLGRCLAMEFASRGCNIAIADIVDSKATVSEIIEKYNVKCAGFKCDISNLESIVNLKTEIEQSMGSVDILVNNAGMILAERFQYCSMNEIQKCIDVNLTSNIKIVKIFLPHMIERKKGRIVSICSVSAIITIPVISVYSASKFGLDGFMEAMYDELCIDGNENDVKLTTVYPYFIHTSKEVENVVNRLKDPYPRYTPEQVASTTVKGVLVDKRKIYILPSKAILLTQKFPDRIIKYLKRQMMSPAEDFRRIRNV